MSIEFLDLRLSEQSNSDAGLTTPLTVAPIVFGDIGLQTADVSPANAGLVRVQLWGYVKLNIGLAATITINVRKNGGVTPIFTTTLLVIAGEESIGFSAVDFPTAVQVLAGQIQYTAEISTSLISVGTTAGARSFSGMAAAGNFNG